MPLTGPIQRAVAVLQAVLDRRIAFRLAIVVAGMFLAGDRRTASAWFVQSLVGLGVKAKVWLATDGAYAIRPLLLPVLKMGIVVVNRLRKDACLFDLPGPDAHGNRIYGKNKLSWAIEEHFHDLKEVWGAGQQQVRNVWSNIGCWHLNQWVFTLVELCC